MSMNKLIEAAEIVGLDQDEIDLPLLAGALAIAKELARAEPLLTMPDAIAMRDTMRAEGLRIINQAHQNQEPEPELVLRIYRTAAGQWAGKLFSGEDEIGGVGGGGSPQEIEQAAQETGIYPDRIEVERPQIG